MSEKSDKQKELGRNLMRAIINQYPVEEIAQQIADLKEAGGDLNTSYAGSLPLFIAADRDAQVYSKHAIEKDFATYNRDVVDLLLREGADPNGRGAVKDSEGRLFKTTPLIRAIQTSYGKRETIDRLLEEPDLEVNAVDGQGDVALLAAAESYQDIMPALIGKGATLKIPNANDKSILAAGLAKMPPEYIELLVNVGANPDVASPTKIGPFQGFYPVQFMAYRGNLHTVELLRDKGARFNVVDQRQNNIFHFIGAMQRKIDASPEENDEKTIMFTTAVDAIVAQHEARRPKGSKPLTEEQRRELLEPYMQQQNADGDSPLHLAAVSDHPGLEAMIRYGANIDAPNGKGETALMRATKSANPAAVHTLLAAGADLAMGEQTAPEYIAGLIRATEAQDIENLRVNTEYAKKQQEEGHHVEVELHPDPKLARWREILTLVAAEDARRNPQQDPALLPPDSPATLLEPEAAPSPPPANGGQVNPPESFMNEKSSSQRSGMIAGKKGRAATIG